MRKLFDQFHAATVGPFKRGVPHAPTHAQMDLKVITRTLKSNFWQHVLQLIWSRCAYSPVTIIQTAVFDLRLYFVTRVCFHRVFKTLNYCLSLNMAYFSKAKKVFYYIRIINAFSTKNEFTLDFFPFNLRPM